MTLGDGGQNRNVIRHVLFPAGESWLKPSYFEQLNARLAEEVLELGEEVKAGEERERQLEADLARARRGWDACLNLLGGWAGLYEEVRRENGELRDQIADYEKYRTMGGPPKSPEDHWINVEAPRVSTADDPDAPPLVRNLVPKSAVRDA